MTLQQMEYVVAVDKYRHFMKAAESCNISQSTLSMMIKKLEDELDMIIFDRNAHPVRPTMAGERIIEQAKVILFNTEQLRELSLSEREAGSGEVRLAIIPTVATDIVPLLFKGMQENNPSIRLLTYEMQTCEIVDKFAKAEIDMAIMATPIGNDNLLEIPLYYEKFYAYVSPSDPLYSQKEIISGEMPVERLWNLAHGNCLREQILNFCDGHSRYTARYEAGSIDTLVRIVDTNGGFTVIPELHIPYLCDVQKVNLRPLVNPDVVREISLVIRRDYVREKIINEIANAVKQAVPERMIDSRLRKFAIKL